MSDSFETLQSEFFEPLAKSLALTGVKADIHQEHSVISGAAGHVRVYFESDRGMCAFAIGPVSDNSSLCSVDEIAARFPRIRLNPQGEQRLTLEEQAAFVSEHWRDLQTMFSPGHLRETLAWRRAQADAYMKRFT